ncbi:MAG: 2-amino-4-hydroxy-6-hydroxymethyldihydropteridine diphosphokinase [Ferruginibacter sp.]
MNKIYLLLGSNMGNSRQQLLNSILLIEKKIGKIRRQSALYSTQAWGNHSQPDFLNQVIVIETALTAAETIQSILSIEEMMGRVRTVKNAPRIIDIDILFFNKEIIQQLDLIVPHPEIQNRLFVLIPLNELSPQFRHPVFNKSIHRLLLDCPDHLKVKKF